MSRYSNTNGGSSNGNNNDNYDDDDVTLKIKELSTVRLTPDDTNSFSHDEFGTSFITNYSDAEVLDGVVLRRDDKPDTWSVYSADEWFHLNPEDGLVYENYNDEEGYSGQMSAQDILEHPRVVGHSTSAGGNSYYFTPVGVVIEEAGDIAMNDGMDAEISDEPAIQVGSACTFLSNSSWTRTFAKKLTEEGDAIINDNGESPTPRGEEDENPKYSNFEWLATEDPTLRSELEGRTLELWVTRETTTFADGGETTYTVPNVLDMKTEEFVEIDNAVDSDGDSGKSTATDGGTMSDSSSKDSDTETTETTETTDSTGLPENVPDKLDDLLGYCARNDKTDPETIRTFAEDEVDNAGDIDWEAAAEEANQRAE